MSARGGAGAGAGAGAEAEAGAKRHKAKEIRRQRHIGTTRLEDSDATLSDLGLLPLRKLYLFMYFSRYFVYSVFGFFFQIFYVFFDLLFFFVFW